MISADRSTEIVFGIDPHNHGLRCRGGCDARFLPASSDSVPALHAAIAMRDDHEVGSHAYHHRRIETPQWGYGNGFARKSR